MAFVVGVLVAAAVMVPGTFAAAAAVAPANPSASPAARRVLAYLQSLDGGKTLAGHHVMYGGMTERELGYIVQTTGKHPALIEFEAGIFQPKDQPEYRAELERLARDATAYWNEGGLVAMCWHWGNPRDLRNTYPNTKVKFDLGKALAAGTPENAALVRDLDLTAGMLAQLRDAGVPVLWRPLHEICGGWFWWGMEGKEQAGRLWRFVFDRYTRHHRLDNLLWVYSASQEMRVDWFPGGESVDIVGVDIYRAGQQGRRENYDRMASVAGGRPVVLSECDVLPDPDAMAASGPLWGWVTTWHSQYVRKNSPETLKRFYHHDRVVTRDELPPFRDGK